MHACMYHHTHTHIRQRHCSPQKHTHKYGYTYVTELLSDKGRHVLCLHLHMHTHACNHTHTHTHLSDHAVTSPNMDHNRASVRAGYPSHNGSSIPDPGKLVPGDSDKHVPCTRVSYYMLLQNTYVQTCHDGYGISEACNLAPGGSDKHNAGKRTQEHTSIMLAKEHSCIGGVQYTI
jgi:hypothetical protein